MSLIVTSWSDVSAVYPEMDTLKNAVSPEQRAILLNRAEAYVHGRLAGSYTTPFSSNNQTAKNLVIDVLYYQNVKTKMPVKGKDMGATLEEQFKMLCAGSMQMVDVSGTVIATPTGDPMWSSTADYHPTFGMGDPMVMAVSSQMLIDEGNARGNLTDEAL